MTTVVIFLLNTRDPAPIRELHDAAVTANLGDSIEQVQLPGPTDEQGVIEGLAVGISAAALLFEVVKFVIQWRAAQIAEQKPAVDIRVEGNDVVIEIKAQSDSI